jgi:hypothetical protein
VFTTGPLRVRAPVSRHRQLGRYRLVPVTTALLMLLAVVAAGGWVTGTRGNADHRFREFVVAGAVGEPVTAGGFDVTVREVRTAAEITDRPGWRHDSGGVWVLVRVRAVAHQEPVSISYAAVRDQRGRAWLATQRIAQPLAAGGGAGPRLEPGIPMEGEIAFEVPREVATELTIRLASSGSDVSMQAVAEIPLPVDDAMLAAGLAEPEPILLAEAEVVVTGPVLYPYPQGSG